MQILLRSVTSIAVAAKLIVNLIGLSIVAICAMALPAMWDDIAQNALESRAFHTIIETFGITCIFISVAASIWIIACLSVLAVKRLGDLFGSTPDTDDPEIDDSDIVYVQRRIDTSPAVHRRPAQRREGASSTPEGYRSYHVFECSIHNTGEGEITIKRISFIIDEIEIDQTPELSGQISVGTNKDECWRPLFSGHDGDSLVFSIANNGWGPATHCEIKTINTMLNKTVDPSHLEEKFAVGPGSEHHFEIRRDMVDNTIYDALLHEEISRRQKEFEDKFETLIEQEISSAYRYYRSIPIQADQERLKKYLSDPKNRKRYMSDPSVPESVGVRTFADVHFSETPERRKAEARIREDHEKNLKDVGLAIGQTRMTYTMTDSLDRESEGTIYVSTSGHWDGTILTMPTSFRFREGEPIIFSRSPYEHETVRAFVIDADQPPHVKDQAVSRTVSPGETERFEVIVSATKSIYTKFRLKFYSAEELQMETGPYEFEIWAPRNQKSSDKCVDVAAAS